LKYSYKAIVKSVHDGDTFTADIDLGFGVWLKDQTIRLFGINAPEVKGEFRSLGFTSRDRLSELTINKEILLETIKDKKEKYGRWLGVVSVDGKSVNKTLVEEGFAKPYEC
jgi:micrococcal nuclease